MNKNENIAEDLFINKENFKVIILSSYSIHDELISTTFPHINNTSGIRNKYLNRNILSLKETILFPKDFLNIYHPEILDKFINIDILILIYDIKNALSFECIKTFYYLYYRKIKGNDKPKNIIILERDNNINDEIDQDRKVNSNDVKEIVRLCKGYFCNHETDDEKLTQILSECLNNLIKFYNYEDDYSLFQIKELEKGELNNILIYGDQKSQKILLDILLKLNYKRIKDNIFKLKYTKMIGNKKYNFTLFLKLMNSEMYFDGECNIFLYDINNNESFCLIRDLIRETIISKALDYKKIYNIFALNTTQSQFSINEKKDGIKKGKDFACEIGSFFSIINTNNNNVCEEIKSKLNDIIEKIINYINIKKNNRNNFEKSFSYFKKEPKENDDFCELGEYDSPEIFIEKTKNRILKYLKNSENSLFNICKVCYSHLNIIINEESNIIYTYCEKCKYVPKATNAELFIEKNKQENKIYHCEKCKQILLYSSRKKKLTCLCNLDLNDKKDTFVPIFLKDCFCNIHKNFHKYYLRYSKKGLCINCIKKKDKNNYLIEEYSEAKIRQLIEQKKKQLEKEKKFLSILPIKFNDCIQSLRTKFKEYLTNKIRMFTVKLDLIKSLEIFKNNNTIISNVNNLNFHFGENFNYNENDSVENKLKYIFNYIKDEPFKSNLYFNNIKKNSIKTNGPYNNFVNKENNVMITDVCGLKNNELICISYDDGKARIFDSNIIEKKNYPKCIIEEFSPKEGINSLYVSKNENNIWKLNKTNKNEIIYLNGYESIKIIEMNNDYLSYNKLYTVKDELKNISHSIELNYNNILTLSNQNSIKLVTFYEAKDNSITDDKTDMNKIFFEYDKTIFSISKISENIISVDYSNDIDFDLTIESLSLNNYTLNLNDYFSQKNKEKLTKVFYLNNFNENKKNTIKKEGDNNCFNIKNSYIFSADYKLYGSISDEKNLLLLSYTKNEDNFQIENFLYIFDFNICQFIYSFKYPNSLNHLKFFVNLNKSTKDKSIFLFIDSFLNASIYFYDEEYINKIYSLGIIKSKIKNISKLDKIINLGKNIIILCSNNSYYILNSSF